MQLVPPDLHHVLTQWAIWARGSYFDLHFKVICRSLEHKHLSRTGSIYTSVEDALRASIRRQDVIKDHDMLQVERAVMRLPVRPYRLAIRLHYVVHKRMPIAQKRRLLGCREDEYELLVLRAATMVGRRLGYEGIHSVNV